MREARRSRESGNPFLIRMGPRFRGDDGFLVRKQTGSYFANNFAGSLNALNSSALPEGS
jgi:hypothetical protein